MSQLRVAVIGLSMGEYHLASVLQSGAEVIAIDVNNHNTDGEFAVSHRCITDGTKPEMDVYQGAKTVAACLAIMESARTGKPIAPNYQF